MEYCAGIDLGTTNTVAAIWKKGAAGPELLRISQPSTDLTPDGFRELPLLDSAVAIYQDRVYVGALARQIGLLGSAAIFASTKRFMGRHWYRQHGNFGWTPTRVAGCILKVVRQQLVRAFGALPSHVCVTIPASFGTEARQATLSAARLAGFAPDRLSLFDEPTAALLSELHSDRPLDRSEPSMHCVVDVGGGTLDVSLVDVRKNGSGMSFDVIGQSRYNELAGDDFDLNLAGLLLDRVEKVHGSARAWPGTERKLLFWSLLQQSREVKHKLSDALRDVPVTKWGEIKETVRLAGLGPIHTWECDVSGSDLVDALREYFPVAPSGTVQGEQFGFFKPIQECLATAAAVAGRPIDVEDIDYVWITGGSAMLPVVGIAVRRILCTRPSLVQKPMYAVALGAARRAGLAAGYAGGDLQVTERIFDEISIKTSAGKFHPVVASRQAIPMGRKVHQDLLQMPTPDRRLVIELYDSGPAGPDDAAPSLMPMAQRRVTFPEVLPDKCPITVAVSVTSNRELQLEFLANKDGKTMQGRVAVNTSAGWEEPDASVVLPDVNVVQPEARRS